MAKKAAKIADAVRPHLRPGEELRSVAQMATVRLPVWLNVLSFGIPKVLFNLGFPPAGLSTKFWYAGVADGRLILIQLDPLGRTRVDRVFSTPLNQVELKGNLLLLPQPSGGELGINPDVRLVTRERFCICRTAKRLTGLDNGQFKKAILAAAGNASPVR